MRAFPSLGRSGAIGGLSLVVTALGWGLNYPVMKFILREWPPLSARGAAGCAAALVLAAILAIRHETLRVPSALWGRLAVAALLNVTSWMGLVTLSLLWLDAGEAAIVAYTMPVWAAALAWPALGERLTARRLGALVLGIGGVAILVAGDGLGANAAKIPGFALGLGGAILFALGAITTKRAPVALRPAPLVAWQVGLGCLPLLIAGLPFEAPEPDALSLRGWAAMAYMAAFPLCICYLSWFAALRRLPAGTAALGTLLTPVVGVISSALALGENLGLREAAALGLTLVGILLALGGGAKVR